ncbi:Protein of unknown function [Paracoccus isoporae]|uniref:DUF3892 domain-containing protein n=1 Tax=Paracoccus isoporae TaxID=591205 RepID=A0A1G7ASX8_9RHOB|nr:DUF3892 domain-containing protein [Paracoccus isoporae]SDE17903.1 Protein of unknown function [Paracoccus isoporae]
MASRKVIDARADSEGDITHVKLEGNQRFTPVKKAMEMADRGEIENAHSVHRRNAKPHLRTNPDSQKSNNLDDMAGDK